MNDFELPILRVTSLFLLNLFFSDCILYCCVIPRGPQWRNCLIELLTALARFAGFALSTVVNFTFSAGDWGLLLRFLVLSLNISFLRLLLLILVVSKNLVLTDTHTHDMMKTLLAVDELRVEVVPW